MPRRSRFGLIPGLFVQIVLALELEIAAQIETADLFVLGELFGRSMLEYFPVDEEIGPVADRKGLVHIMVGDQDADIPVFEAGYYGLNIFHGDGVHTGKGFIQQNEFRVHGEGTGDFGPSPFPATERIPVVLPYMVQMKFVQQGFQPLLLFTPRQSGHFQHGHQIVLDAQLPEYGGLLRQVSNAHLGPFIHRQPGDIGIVQEDIPRIGSDEADHHVESGSLAGAVRAQQSYDLSLLELDGNMVYHGPASVALHKVLRMNGEAHGAKISSWLHAASRKAEFYTGFRVCGPPDTAPGAPRALQPATYKSPQAREGDLHP